MSRPHPDDPHRRIYRRLTDESRKSPRGPYRFAYTEEQFDRRIHDEGSLPLHEEQYRSASLLSDQLCHEQALELIESLGLTSRQMRICRMRLEGYTTQEIADELGLSDRRVRSLIQDLKRILTLQLRDPPQEDVPHGSDPYYGWQETFLDSQRR